MIDERTARMGLKAFFNIAKAWDLSESDEAAVLGQLDRETMRAWKSGKGPEVGQATILRISYVLGIFRAINKLLPRKEVANAWVKKPNKAPIFGGRSALDRMTDGDIEGLQIVRQHLDAEAPPLESTDQRFGALKKEIEKSEDFDELPDEIIAAKEGR